MGSRGSPSQTKAAREWARFVAANRQRFEVAGLPALATLSLAHWDDLVTNGSFKYHHDPRQFTISRLAPERYAAFVDLVESYFVAGYEYYTPASLKLGDQSRLASRFSR